MLTALKQNIIDSSLFYFFGDDVKYFSPASFTILKTQTYQTKNFVFEAHIIGQSHFFTITDTASQKIIVVEALACVPLHHIPATFSHSFTTSPHVSSGFNLQQYGFTLTSSAQIGSRQQKDWKQPFGVSPLFMEYTFPGNLSPRTIFSLQEKDAGVIVETLHEFEEDNSVTPLLTKTEITFLT